MWRALASNALTLMIVGLVAAAGLLAWAREQYVGPGPLEQAICVRVERGSSFAALSRALQAQGAVSDARILRIGADYTGRAEQLKFGSCANWTRRPTAMSRSRTSTPPPIRCRKPMSMRPATTRCGSG
jgi:cell division protein YceG involved in septum cleavage